MSEQRFDAGVRTIEGIAVIDLRGDINAHAEPALDEAYAAAERQGAGAIVLNVHGVDYINLYDTEAEALEALQF